jgi:16S rRNA U516 pseudouridylate synthase RsuA-like enzyme
MSEDKVKIDLHGLTHGEALNCIIRKIEEYRETETQLLFITGNSDEMQSQVKNMAETYGLKTTSLIRTEISVWTDGS